MSFWKLTLHQHYVMWFIMRFNDIKRFVPPTPRMYLSQGTNMNLIRLNLIFVSPKDAIYQWILDCDITWIRKMSMKLAVFIRYCQCRVKVYSFKNCLRIFYTQDYIKQNILWALLWRMFFNKLDSDNKLLILVVKWREKYSHYY